MRNRATIGIFLFAVSGCASDDKSLGCADLLVSCSGEASEQQWWRAVPFTASQDLQIQSGVCGAWLAFISNGATARYDDVDLGTREGKMRLRVLVSADDASTPGGTLTLFADGDTTTAVTSCAVTPTGGWFNWVVVDCGLLPLRGVHSLTFKFSGSTPYTSPYVFNLAAFGVVRSGAPDCTVAGPKFQD